MSAVTCSPRSVLDQIYPIGRQPPGNSLIYGGSAAGAPSVVMMVAGRTLRSREAETPVPRRVFHKVTSMAWAVSAAAPAAFPEAV
jgi:hypothetical protein